MTVRPPLADLPRGYAQHDLSRGQPHAVRGGMLGRIDLAEEPAFHLGALLVEPSTGRVRFAGQEVSLQPRVLQVLVALARRPRETVSREELMTACWGIVVVGDDALTRCILRLRSMLQESGSDARIETIPRIGYRLDGDPVWAPSQGGTFALAQAASPPRLPVARLLAAVAACLVTGVVSWQMTTRHVVTQTEPPAFSRRTIVADPGSDMEPALSPDGGQLVYSAITDPPRRLNLYLRSTEGGPRLQLTRSPSRDYAAAWSPDGSRIAFARNPVPERCELMVRTVPTGTEQAVGRCDGTGITTLAWSADGSSLYYSDRPLQGLSRFLARRSLATGEVEHVTTPTATAIGDERPAPSPDGKTLGFVRVQDRGREDLLLLDLASGTIRTLIADRIEISGLAWSPDSRQMTVSSMTAQGGTLERIEIASGRARVLQSGLRHSGTIAGARRSERIAVETVSAQVNLFAHVVTPFGEISPGTPVAVSSTRESLPTIAPDGIHMAFVSERGGQPDIWFADVTDAQAAPQQLTSSLGGVINALAWSHDGKMLAAVNTRGNKTRLLLLDPATRRIRVLVENDQQKSGLAWGDGNRSIAFSSKDEQGWQVRRVPLSDPAAARTVSEPGFVKVQAGSIDGTMVALHQDGSFWLMREGDERNPRKVADPVADTDPMLWAIAGENLLRMHWNQGVDEMLRTDMRTGETTVAIRTPALVTRGIAVTPDGKLLIAPRIQRRESDIDLIELATNAR